MRFQAFRVVLVFFLLFMFSSCVEDSDFLALKSQVNSLSQRVSVLEGEVSSLREEIRDLKGSTKVRLDLISGEVDELKGALQESEARYDDQYYQLLKRVEAIEKEIAGIKNRVSVLEGVRESISVSPEKPEATSAQKPEGPKALYAKAFNLYRSGDIEGARRLFEKFLSVYPDDPLSDNALFWIGETYYVQGNYPEAIVRYQEVIAKYPKGDKVPSALLKLGFSQEKMGNTVDARVTFQKLIKAFPGTPQAGIAKKELEKLSGRSETP